MVKRSFFFKSLKTILFVFVPLLCFSQEIVWEKTFNKRTPDIKEAFEFVNRENSDISLFLVNRKKILAYLLDKNYRVKDSLISDKLPSKYKELLGGAVLENGDYIMYLANNSKSEISAIQFSYKENKAIQKTIDVNFRNQKFVQTFNVGNKFILVTVNKESSFLNFYNFNGTEIEHKIANFNGIHFFDADDKPTKLYHLLTKYKGFHNLVEIEKIDKTVPNSIESTSKKTKIYRDDNTITITFDEHPYITQLVSINLEDLSINNSLFNKPLSDEIKTKKVKSNTFKYDDFFFTFASTPDELMFAVNDFSTGELLSKKMITRNQPVNFKNSPMIQKGGFYNSYRELEDSNKFIRKVNNSNLGVSVYKMNNNYQITLGAFEETEGGGTIMMPMGTGIPIASVGTINVFFNPYHFAYSNYINSKSIIIDCIFDNHFKHIEGNLQKNVFEKIQEYQKDIVNIEAELIFKYHGLLLVGQYSPFSNKYILKKFMD